MADAGPPIERLSFCQLEAPTWPTGPPPPTVINVKTEVAKESSERGRLPHDSRSSATKRWRSPSRWEDPRDRRCHLRMLLFCSVLASLPLWSFAILFPLCYSGKMGKCEIGEARDGIEAPTHRICLGECNERTSLILIFIPGLLGLFMYACQACCNGELSYLQHVCTTKTPEGYMEELKAAVPKIYWIMTCCHFEKRGPRRRIGLVKSWCGARMFPFNICEDVSKTPGNLHRDTAIKLRVLKGLCFKDEHTRKVFEETKQDFVNANKHRDKYYRIELQIYIDGFKDRVLFDSAKKRPWCASPICCCLFFVVGLMWPYRVFLNSNMQRGTLQIVKRIQRFP